MPREEATWGLTKACIFEEPMTEELALRKWGEYREKVEALPVRARAIPEQIKLSLTDKQEISRLRRLTKHRADGRYIRAVMKINPSALVVHQFTINIDRAKAHAKCIKSRKDLAKLCLGIGQENPIVLREQRGDTAVFKLPHYEFVLQLLQNGQIAASERARYITVVKLEDRMWLWGGYHRTYACMTHTAAEEVGSAPLVTLTCDVPDVGVFLGRNSPRPGARDVVLGDRPAFFSDFFEDELCMKIKLRKQRLELHVRNGDIRATTPVWIDETI